MAAEEAILTADMVGFSGRMRSDQETVISLLVGTYYRLALEAAGLFNGNVFRREGDAVWCSFPSPREAVEAGLWMLSGLSAHNARKDAKNQIRVRVGVAFGPVFYSTPPVPDEAPTGRTLNFAKRLENTAAEGTLQIPSSLLSELAADRIVVHSRPTPDTLCLQPSQSYEREVEAKRRPRSSLAWVFALDFSQVAASASHEWLRWAVMATQTHGAQVYEWQDRHHLLVWPSTTKVEPWPGAHAQQLPFPAVEGSRCSISFGEVVVAALESLEGPSLIGSTVERALVTLEQAPAQQGLWCDGEAASKLGWSLSEGQDADGRPVFGRAEGLSAGFSWRAGAAIEEGLLATLARSLAKGTAAVILASPLVDGEQLQEIGSAGLLEG